MTNEPDAGQGTGQDPKRPKQNVFKRFYTRFRKPIKILLGTYAVLLVLATLVSFPAVRAVFYPLCPGVEANFWIYDYSPLFTTKETPAFLVNAGRCTSYQFKIFRADDVARLTSDATSHRYPNQSIDYSSIYDSQNHFSGLKPVATVAGSVHAQDISQGQFVLEVKEQLRPGEYLGVVAAPGMLESASHSGWVHFIVTDLGAILKHDSEKIIVSSVDLNTRKPWPNAVATGFNSNDFAETVGATKCGANGIGVVKRPPNMSDEEWNNLSIDVRSGDHLAYFGAQQSYSYHHSIRSADTSFAVYDMDKFRTFLDYDRPIYRIGQSISYRGIVSRVSPKGLVNIGQGAELRVAVYDPEGTEFTSNTIRTDSAGGFVGTIAANQVTKTGQYQVHVTYPDTSTDCFSIPVEQYRKPEFKVDVIPEKTRYSRGDKVRFKIQANYYFGGAIKNAKIKYHVNSALDNNSKLSLTSVGTADSDFYSGWPSDNRFHPYGNGSPFGKEGELTTDDAGQALLEFDVPIERAKITGPYSYNFLDDTFSVSVETTDLSRKTNTSEGSVPVTRGDFALIANAPTSSVKAGEKITVNVKAVDYNKQPLKSQKIKAKLVRWDFDKQLFDKDGGYKEIPVDSMDVTTDDSGNALVSFNTKKDYPSSSYYVDVESVDSKNRTVGDVTSIWLFGDRMDYWFQQNADQEQYSIQLDKDIYRPGDTVKAVIKTNMKPDEEAYMIASVEGAAVRQYKQMQVKGPVTLVEFPLDATYMPNAYISASFILPGHEPFTMEQLVKVTPLSKFVNLSIGTDKQTYRPGDTVKYTVTAKDKSGAPVPNMHVSASVADEGVYAVHDTMMSEGLFYENREDIFNSIYAMIANEVSTRFTFDEAYVGTPRETPIFDGGGLLALHAPILMFISGRGAMQEMDCCCQMESKNAAPPAACPAPALSRGDATTVGKGGDTFANAKQHAPNAPPEPRVRSNFLDAAAWYPLLVTGAAGTATFSAKLPDDLTTWRATINGIDTGLRVGEGTSTVTSTQDFMARLALPRFYTEYDETVVSGLVHNLSQVDQTVTVSMTTTPNIQLLEPASVTINVPKGDEKRQSWKVKILKAGEAKVLFKAVGSTLADAEERKLPIQTFGYRAYFAKNGLMKEDSEEKAFPVKLPPDAILNTGSFNLSMSSSAIGPVLGNFEKLIDYPYGCTEQTLSKLIPSVVAKRLSKNLGVEMPADMNTMFDEAYELAMPKLLKYQHGDGGWGWWENDTSDPYMTAHVLEGFYLLQQAGMGVDDSSMERGRDFLKSKIEAVSADPWGRMQSEDQAKAVYVLSLYNVPLNPITRTWQLANIKKMSPEALAYMTMAFEKVGDRGAAKMTYDRLKELRNDSLEYSNWDHTREMLTKMGADTRWDYSYRFTGVETTALALRATVVMEPKNEALLEQISRWLVLQHDENGWENTKTTATVFLALLEKELSLSPNRTTDYTVKIEALNKLVKQLSFKKTFEKGEQGASVPLVPAPGSIKLNKSGPGWLYYNTLLSYDRPLKPGEQPVLNSIPADLKVRREIFRLLPEKKGDAKATTYTYVALGTAPVKTGDMIMIKVTVDCPMSVPYVMVESAFPSGGEVMTQPPALSPEQKLDKSQPDNWYWWTHQDVLDDKVAFFAANMPSGTSEFRTYLRMEMPGKFNINPVNMEAMYTDKVHARSVAHDITVVE